MFPAARPTSFRTGSADWSSTAWSDRASCRHLRSAGSGDLTRLRKAQANERASAIQRLEKVLQDAGIKLSSVASHTYPKSAREMLEALLTGVTDPEQLIELSNGKMRAKIPQLREAPQSRFQVEHHGIMVAQELAHIDALDGAAEPQPPPEVRPDPAPRSSSCCSRCPASKRTPPKS
jgi:hypothetical protein